jgi:hypothetical protein
MHAVTVEDYGSVVLFRPHTRAARLWLERNTAWGNWQWVDGALMVEHRYAADIRMGLSGSAKGF